VRLLNFWGERKRKKEKNTKGRVNFEGKEKKKRRLSFFSVLERYLICVRAQRKTNQTSKSKLPESVFHGGGEEKRARLSLGLRGWGEVFGIGVVQW